jgi:hypothetical protein
MTLINDAASMPTIPGSARMMPNNTVPCFHRGANPVPFPGPRNFRIMRCGAPQAERHARAKIARRATDENIAKDGPKKRFPKWQGGFSDSDLNGVCGGVWIAMAGRSVTDKILAVVFPISAFVAAGFEHSVANMYFIPLGILLEPHVASLGAPALSWTDLLSNLARNARQYGGRRRACRRGLLSKLLSCPIAAG